MGVTTARQKVFGYLKKNKSGTSREIARSLKMSTATVRHHLRVLVSEDRLEVDSVEAHKTRGRPEKSYSLPRAALGDNLSGLILAIWKEADNLIQLEALAKLLAGNSESKNQPSGKRMGFIVERLNQMNYHARWEAGAAGPRLIFGHCPYAAILAQRPELCRMDSALLEQLSGQQSDQLARIGEGSSICLFALSF